MQLNPLIVSILLYGQIHYANVKGRIGILYNPGGHSIIRVYCNTPASRAGLKAKDKVLHYDSDDIKGEAGTYVTLTIKRGNEILTFIIERVPEAEINERCWIHDA